MLDEAGRHRVEEAVAQAERGSAGELVVVLAARASNYRSVPFVYGLVTALVVPWPLLWLTGIGMTRMLLAQLAVALVVMLATSPLTIRHRLVPRAIRHRRAREAAQRAFASLGLVRTRARTGVLLYLAAAEHHAEVIGDVAISARVDEAEWRAIITDLVETLHASGPAEGLVAAITRIGILLARHVPSGAENPDELPNRLVVLD